MVTHIIICTNFTLTAKKYELHILCNLSFYRKLAIITNGTIRYTRSVSTNGKTKPPRIVTPRSDENNMAQKAKQTDSVGIRGNRLSSGGKKSLLTSRLLGNINVVIVCLFYV